jgi:hypothetical protein
MAIIKAAARLMIRERQHYAYQGPVLCLGEPDIYLTAAELQAETGFHGEVIPDADGRFVMARSFLSALGLNDVTSLDIAGCKLTPTRIHDLNNPLPADLLGRFGLVLDPGTIEHVFDLKMGLSNVVRALQPGGVAIHFVPIYSYNGGYLSINPNVLTDFYLSNGFADIKSFIIMWDRYRPFAARSRCYPYGPVLESRHALADWDQYRFTPHLLTFARRSYESDDIVGPTQHEVHGFNLPPQPLVRPLVRRFGRLLPQDTAHFLRSWYYRYRQLHRSRETSFWI